MTTAEEKKLREDFAQAGYDLEEIDDVIEGLQQIQAWQKISAEDMYKELFSKKATHV